MNAPGPAPDQHRGGSAADAVARNRAAPARRTPGRVPVGAAVARRLTRITAAVILVATLIFAAAVVLSRLS